MNSKDQAELRVKDLRRELQAIRSQREGATDSEEAEMAVYKIREIEKALNTAKDRLDYYQSSNNWEWFEAFDKEMDDLLRQIEAMH